MSDVRIYQKDDGGEIDCVGGQIGLDDGLDAAVYLSLFGGNSDDSGIDGDKPKQWWGNADEPDVTRHYRSELQYLLNTLPLIPMSLRRFEAVAGTDLAWMLETGLASFVGAIASMPALNTVKLQLKIVIQDRVYEPAFLFRKNQQ
jgi:phage gp46-like protein